MNNIFLPTIQNTGTWFLMGFFKNHKDISGTVEIRFLEHLARGIVHKDMGIKQEFVKGGRTVFHSHICTNAFKDRTLAKRMYQAFICSVPTVLPIRDPMMSLITMREKAFTRKIPDNLSVTEREILRMEIWNQTVEMFEGLQKLTDIFYFPVDVPQTVDERYNQLLDLVTYCKLSGTLDDIGNWAREWKVLGSRGDYKEKRKYAERD